MKNDVPPLITDRSLARLGAMSLLGEGAVDITAGPGGTPIPEWGYVPTGVAAGSIAQLTAEASSGISEAKALVADIRAGKGTMGKLFTDDAVYREFDALVTASERVARSDGRRQGHYGETGQRSQAVQRAARRRSPTSTRSPSGVRKGEGSLGQLMNDPALAKSLNQTSSEPRGDDRRLNRGEGTAGKLLNDDALYKRMDSMTARLDTVLQQLNDGQGTAGLLLRDKQLYENMNQTVGEMKSLIAEIKKDPKKYLNVKVSIF